jgi:quercetin dioxygenase-like cupin family protein
MITNAKTPVSLWRKLSLATMVAGTTAVLSTAALAGQCPADKVAANAMKPGPSEPAGVTDEVLSHVDLSKEAVHLKDRMFRMRRLVVQPGGVVPTHSHGDRPALIYIIEGSITEYSSNCAVPIEHKAGEAAMESVGLSHWWKNNGSKPAVLISADILHTETMDDHMM